MTTALLLHFGDKNFKTIKQIVIYTKIRNFDKWIVVAKANLILIEVKKIVKEKRLKTKWKVLKLQKKSNYIKYYCNSNLSKKNHLKKNRKS